jgi:hypothetical protein
VSAGWLEIIGLLLGGGAVAKLLDLFLFRDQDVAAFRRELLARVDALQTRVNSLEREVQHWAELATDRDRLRVRLMLEVNEALVAAGKPEKYSREVIFAPLPQPPEKD